MILIGFIALLLFAGYIKEYSNPLNVLILKDDAVEEYICSYSNLNFSDYYSCGELKIIYGKDIIKKVDFSNDSILGLSLTFENLDIHIFEKDNNLELISKENVEGIKIYKNMLTLKKDIQI